MNKCVLIFLFLLAAASVFGQNKSKINLVSSETAHIDKGPNGKAIGKAIKGVFQQQYSTLSSDSSYFYTDTQIIDAFGHVVINQGDTLHIYSDKLNYNDNTKIAILTGHVKMVDKDAVLTTEYFTYNTATRIGIYTGGGKIVNKESTLISKNGYYFAFTHDEYFRYNVVCTTPDAVIKTDTMRYNSGSKITYFYGPTNIYGKDKDVLYTENGTYNTETEQAFFGKNNLYTQGTKTLKGDSLFYDRLKGYGRATKHVIFNDTEQKATVRGDLGEYYKAEDRMVMTQNPYMIFVTEDSTATKPGDKPGADTLLKTQKTVSAAVTAKKFPGVANTMPIDNSKLTLQGITDSVTKKLPENIKISTPATKLTLKGITDSVTKRAQPVNVKNPPKKQNTIKDIAQVKSIDGKDIKIDAKSISIKEPDKKPGNVKTDSLFLVADTLETQVLTVKALRELKEKRYQYDHRDTSIKIVKRAPPVVYKKSPKFLTLDPPQRWYKDTSYLHPDFFGKPDPPRKVEPKVVPKTVPKVVKTAPAPKKTAQDSLKEKQKADFIALHAPRVLSDTSRIRIITGHHNAKLFKSDLQAKSDSMFYSTSDSTIRCYVNPIIWTQGSQLSGDTVNLQMKNKKLDNIDLFPSGFIVNIEKNDSTHFNQVSGKKIHGTFKNSKLNTLDIVGNAETIYFKRDSVTNKVTDMDRTLSGRIFVLFKNGEVSNINSYEQPDDRMVPIAKTKEEERILKGFLWKPKERPASKEAILSAYHKRQEAKKTAAKTPAKPAPKTPGDVKLSSDTTAKKPAPKTPAGVKLSNDTTLKKPAIKIARDNTIKDTAALKKAGIKKP